MLILKACDDVVPNEILRRVMKPATSDVAHKLVALKVLIVDDEPAMRKVTHSLLQAIGIRTVYEANDGNSGLAAIRRLSPDVVIVDWEMPHPNGPGIRAHGALAGYVSHTARADHHAHRSR